MVLNFIPATIGAVLLALGVLGIFMNNKLSNTVGSVGKVVGLKKQTTFITFIVIGLLVGGFGVISGLVGNIGIGTASITGQDAVAGATFGTMTLKLTDGISNATTTEDTIDDSDKFMTIYSADASIEEDDEYSFNITIGRSSIAEDASAKVTCVLPDGDVSASEGSLAKKSGGKVTLAFIGARDTGTHSDDYTVWTYVDFSEGTGSSVIEVNFDADESYHDAMTDLQDYVDVDCSVSADGSTDSTTVRIYADS
jgi:hypothetical protein